MPNYKLIYFDFKARGEVPRLLFKIAGVDFEDYRIPRPEWDQIREKISPPFGQVPILEVDGKRLCQSHAIERYLAKKFGLAGSTDWETARCDMIAQCVEDLIPGVTNIRLEQDAKIKEELKTKYLENMDTWFTYLSNFLDENRENSEYFVGKGITYTDLVAYAYPTIIEFFLNMTIDWNKWPKLKAHRAKVESHEKVSDWIKNRPKTAL